MPCLEAEPESWQAGGGDGLGGMTAVSSDLCGAKARLIPADKAALARGKSGRRRSIALQGFRLALPRRVRWDTGGTTSVSSDFREAEPRPILEKSALRWRAGE